MEVQTGKQVKYYLVFPHSIVGNYDTIEGCLNDIPGLAKYEKVNEDSVSILEETKILKMINPKEWKQQTLNTGK